MHGFQETILSLERSLGSFSTSISPLLASSCLAIGVFLFDILFYMILSGRELQTVLLTVSALGFVVLVLASVALSHSVAIRVSWIRPKLIESEREMSSLCKK